MGKMVEEVSASLVREYLSRKGLKKTIACLDDEFPRSSSSINSREDLRRLLHLDNLYKKNKVQEFPFKTLLELVVWHQTDEGGSSKRKQNSSDTQAPRGERNLTDPTSSPVIVASGTDDNTAGFVQRKSNVSRSPKSETISSPPRVLTSYSKGVKPPISPNSNLTEGTSDRLSLPSSQETSSSPVGMDQSTEKRRFVRESHRSRNTRVQRGMMAGPVANSSLEGSKKRVTRKSAGSSPLLSAKDGEIKDDKDWLNSSTRSTMSHSTFPEKGTPNPPAYWEGVEDLPSEGHPPGRECGGFEKVHSLRPQPHILDMSPTAADMFKYVHMSTMTLDDIDDEEEELCGLARPPLNHCLPQHTFDSHPIDLPTATALKEILLGSPVSCFGEEWKCQSFSFSDKPALRYGIIQRKGGPCGVLASVQACILQKLLFEDTECDSAFQQMQPSQSKRTRCLALAIADILWRAGDKRKAVVAINSGRRHFTPVGKYKSDGVLEMITCSTVNSLEELSLFLEQHVSQFELGPFGCILLTISAILSRSIEGLRSDMDVPTTTLIGAHGYCTQELVNLLLFGRAVSNVFNDEMRLESGNGIFTLLKGVSCRSDIGLLSLFEHYNICKVGEYLKRPRHPIWVVCSESHFSVLFSLNKSLTSDLLEETTFDLYYYDGLANQQEQIRLTVCMSKMAIGGDCEDGDLIPPLEHCIRTRWRNAVVDWNDTEPIL
ncbi:probable ubiquitin carboxyl-terminal hydrolase MINDY-4 [Clupea harengus]|uniref:Ubiquitin carboxyl-terminal hydrolase MINDY n=1 Tax=Clupea harengus TaxID=7950 RepID=A0A6P8G3G1_CLUHA|nr:probable ubiquitin carboxyl-terminal hydrolase MINDY-4 [Clupea harengus]